MDEKDKQIERLFDEYASSLEPNDRLADKARQKMQTPKRRRSKKPAMWIGIAAACAAAFAVTVLSVVAFFNSGKDSNGGDVTGSAPSRPVLQSYRIDEVRATAVDGDFARSYIDTSALSDAQIFSESYYACYIKDTDKFVYLKAVLGISYADGTIQMSVIAENSAYINDERTQEFKSVMHGGEYSYRTDFVKGEYVTVAYRATSGYRYYVTALGNVDGAQDIAKIVAAPQSDNT